MAIDDLPQSLVWFLTCLSDASPTEIEHLQGGAISRTVRLILPSGQSYVAKYHTGAPPDLYPIEAAGLNALRIEGAPRVPEVVSVTSDYLLLEDLGHSEEKSDSYWEDLGRQLATLHRHTHDAFGYHTDNYLGLSVQRNDWTADGYEFYISHRILRYLEEGKCPQVLTRADRQSIEFFCSRLRERVPTQGPVLCHGDLWTGNLIVTRRGTPAYVDPAVHYGWPEADLGMTTQYGRFDDGFYQSYAECSHLEDGWQDRLELYHIKEWLSMVAHFGEDRKSLARLREFLAKHT